MQRLRRCLSETARDWTSYCCVTTGRHRSCVWGARLDRWVGALDLDYAVYNENREGLSYEVEAIDLRVRSKAEVTLEVVFGDHCPARIAVVEIEPSGLASGFGRSRCRCDHAAAHWPRATTA